MSGSVEGLAFDKRKMGDVLVVRFAGRMTEAFKGAALAKELEGKVLLDLAGVERITSFGVREWLQMVQGSQARVRALYLARCSEPVVSQVSMIRRFTGAGQIVSFYAPYCCELCAHQFERLVDCVEDAPSLAEGKPPQAVCPRCDGPCVFDDDAETYFGFFSQHGAKTITPEVRSILNLLESSEDPVGGDAIEKVVHGRSTRVKMSSKLDASVRWSRIVDGLEGQVIFDFGNISGSTAEGAAGFESTLRGLDHPVEDIRIEGCPRLLVERLAGPTWPSRAQVDSAVVDGRCASCAALRTVIVDVAANAERLREGQDPRVACKRCSTPLTFDGSRALLLQLGAHAGRVLDAQARASEPPAAGQPMSGSRGPVAVLPSTVPSPALPSLQPRSASNGSRAFVALIGLVCVVAALFVLWRAGLSQSPQAPGALRSGGDGARPSVSRTALTASWSDTNELPPAWVERPFVIEGAEILVVGRGGPAVNELSALAAARNDALDRLASHILGELEATGLYELVTARAASAGATSEQGPGLIDRVAGRFLHQVGAFATPERVDVVVRQHEKGIEAIARYKLSRQSFTAAASIYRQTTTFQGITVARFFPQLERTISTGGDLIVVEVESTGDNATSGIVAGDIVLAVNERPVGTVETFGKVAMDSWARAAPGGSMTIQLESHGVRRSVSFLKSKAADPR